MKIKDITEASKPNNPKLWSRAKAEASKKYDKHSAYKMGWASSWYKKRGGTWSTVSESSQLDEITRPESYEDVIKFLHKHGYDSLGSGKFATVFQRKSRPGEVFKIFKANDDAYMQYLQFLKKHQSNKHFPKIIGKPMRITGDYYGVKLEKLEPVYYKDLGDLLFYLEDYTETGEINGTLKNYFDSFPEFKKAIQALKRLVSADYDMGFDIHSGNVMWRGNTLVLTDPVYTPSQMDESTLTEISRPETQRDADEILRKNGYKRLNYGAFGAVYEKGDKVVKTFTSLDTAYLEFIKMVKKSNYNPHFPMFYGNPIKINDQYYAIKQENLKEYRGDPSAIRRYIQYLASGLEIGYKSDFEEIEEITYEYPRFKEACEMLANMIKSNPDLELDLHKDNIMKRGRTIVFIDPFASKSVLRDKLSSLPEIGKWESDVKEKNKIKWSPSMQEILDQLDNDYLNEDTLNEISRPSFQDADKILRKAGYDRLGTGAFGAAYHKGNTVLKLFSSEDDAYISFLKLVKKHQDNPHFPKIYGNPIKVNNDYYGIKIEDLSEYDWVLRPHTIQAYIRGFRKDEDHYLNDFLTSFISYNPEFPEACKLIAEFLDNNPKYHLDLHSGNMMMRGNTLVIIDPVIDPMTLRSKNLPKFNSWELHEDLRKWFDEKWVDVSRKVDGKHPECGASANNTRRKKDSSAAYPKCVKKSKAQSMTKKEKESASRRKRSAQKDAGSKQTFVSTKVK